MSSSFNKYDKLFLIENQPYNMFYRINVAVYFYFPHDPEKCEFRSSAGYAIKTINSKV